MDFKFYITLVRHGETYENREKIMQGQKDTLLSDIGKQQASLVGTRLQDEYFTHMYSSDLRRAADTAEAIVSANCKSTCELKLDNRLRERHFGVMQGRKFSDLHDLIKKTNSSFEGYTPEGAETMQQVIQRAVSFFKSVCDRVTTTATQTWASESNSSDCERDHRQGTSSRTSDCKSDKGNKDGLSAKDGSGIGQKNDIDSSNTEMPNTSNMSQSGSLQNDGRQTTSFLIVSHGLLLKELKRLILDRFDGKLSDNDALIAQRVSPNTGVSKFAMSVSKDRGKVRVKCIECCLLNCNAHLCSLS